VEAATEEAEITTAADSIGAEEENASSNDAEESADAEPAENAAVDEDDTSSKLHFEMSAEDIDMLEAQLRELSAPTPSPVPPAVPETETVHPETPELAKTPPLPEEAETAQIELTPVVEFCSAEIEADDMKSAQENYHDHTTPTPPNSLEPVMDTGGKSEM
jgi:hypothetical protein